jgi:hypothetical protein
MSAPQQSIWPQPPCNDQAQPTLLDELDFYKQGPSRKHKCSCSCSCGCPCSRDESKDNGSINDTSSPARGRSNTPRYDRTNGNGKPHSANQASSPGSTSWQTAISSVNGQEGLAGHQLERNVPVEVGDLGTHAHNAIQDWLEQHHTPTHPYGFRNTPKASMLVEASTMAPSLPSSGFLSPRVPSSADLLSFATGGFEEGGLRKVKSCGFTPLWLAHERRYCRGCQLDGSVEAIPVYPVTIDMFGIE